MPYMHVEIFLCTTVESMWGQERMIIVPLWGIYSRYRIKPTKPHPSPSPPPLYYEILSNEPPFKKLVL